MPTDGFKEALSQLSPCHRCEQPPALDSTKGHPYCSNSNCVMFRYKMPQSTWNKLAECSNVVQLPQHPNVELQKVVDAFIYVWHNRQDSTAVGSLEDVIADYEAGRPESHSETLLEHATFKTMKMREEINELKEENRRLERNSITIDGKPTSQAAVNALLARVEAAKKQLENVGVWAVEDADEKVHYSAFQQWMCTKWIEDHEGVYPDGDFSIVSLNVCGKPDLYGEDSSGQRKDLPQPSEEKSVWQTVQEAQLAAEFGLKKASSEQERSRALLQVTSALLALTSFTLTQTGPKV